MAPIIPPPPGVQPATMEASLPAPPHQPAVMQPIVPHYSSSCILITKLVLRALTAVLTFISLIILTTNTFKLTTVYTGYYYDFSTTTKLKFNDILSYRYMLFTILLGLLYSILQLALTIFHLKSGKRVSNILVYIDFFGDLVLTYALATGAAAGFAVSVDMASADYHVFFAKGSATASLLFLGSVCSAGSLVFAAFGLEKRL